MRIMKRYLRRYAYAFAMGAAILVSGCGILVAAQLPANWREINTGLPRTGVGVGSLIIDPADASTIYARTYRGNVFKSTDAGESWHALSGVVGVNSLAVDPVTSSTVYAGTDHGLFKSGDGGKTWSAANNGLTNGLISKVAIDATTSTLYAAASYAANEGIFKSTNGADSWESINTGLSRDSYITALTVDPIASSTIYVSYSVPTGVGASVGGVIKSINGGESWSVIGN